MLPVTSEEETERVMNSVWAEYRSIQGGRTHPRYHPLEFNEIMSGESL